MLRRPRCPQNKLGLGHAASHSRSLSHWSPVNPEPSCIHSKWVPPPTPSKVLIDEMVGSQNHGMGSTRCPLVLDSESILRGLGKLFRHDRISTVHSLWLDLVDRCGAYMG